jgi:hypothetical protein
MSRQAILKTLHYFDLFDYPLKIEEIHRYLVESLKIDVLKEILSQMIADDKRICADNGFYCLSRREEIVELRQQREKWSRPKLEKAKKIASVLEFIPWIKLIGVTGALAMGNCDEGDDIDLMIITSSNRLWLTRGLVVTFLRLTGQYRRPGKIKDRICPNLIISEEALEFPDHDLFTAHEIAQMKPIFDRGGVCQGFIEANSWVEGFLPNAIEMSNLKSQMSNPYVKSQNFLFDFLEKTAYKLQLGYMEKKKTIETTTPTTIRFHPQDIRQKVLDEYQRRVYDLPK